MWSFIVTCSTDTVHYIIITNGLLSHGMCLPDNTKLSFIQSLITVTFSYGSLNLGQPISQPKTFFRHAVLDTLYKTDQIPSSNSDLLGWAGLGFFEHRLGVWGQLGRVYLVSVCLSYVYEAGTGTASFVSSRYAAIVRWPHPHIIVSVVRVYELLSSTPRASPLCICVRKVIVFAEVLNS